MTLYTAKPRTFKRAAQSLSKLGAGTSLMTAQEVLSRATGHRDMNHLKAVQTQAATHPDLTIRDQTRIVDLLTTDLKSDTGAVIDALMRTRFFGQKTDSETALRIVEESHTQMFAGSTLHHVGARCDIRNEDGAITGRGLVIHKAKNDGLSEVLKDWSVFTCVGYEIVAPADPRQFIPLRFWLPYGKWIEPDGATVLFSRDYYPLWRIEKGKAAVRDDPLRFVPHVHEEWLMESTSSFSDLEETMAQGFDILRAHRVVYVPRLVDWLPKCLMQGKSLLDFKVWPTPAQGMILQNLRRGVA